MAFSMMTDPSNHLPPEYDDITPPNYDPRFTETISANMRVPHKLGVGGFETEDSYNLPEMSRAAPMTVPERIIVAGQNQHMGMKEDFKLDLDPVRQDFSKEYVGLSTPPRVLTLEERPFPALEDPNDSMAYKDAHNPSVQNGYLSATPRGSSFQRDLLATPGDGLLLQDYEDLDDISILRRNFIKLSRHVVRLEEENARRSQRELILYPLVVGYILLQTVKWLLRSN